MKAQLSGDEQPLLSKVASIRQSRNFYPTHFPLSPPELCSFVRSLLSSRVFFTECSLAFPGGRLIRTQTAVMFLDLSSQPFLGASAKKSSLWLSDTGRFSLIRFPSSSASQHCPHSCLFFGAVCNLSRAPSSTVSCLLFVRNSLMLSDQKAFFLNLGKSLSLSLLLIGPIFPPQLHVSAPDSCCVPTKFFFFFQINDRTNSNSSCCTFVDLNALLGLLVPVHAVPQLCQN